VNRYPSDQWATSNFYQSPKKHGLHRSTLCNDIATPCPETTARLYDYADNAKNVKKEYTKKKYWGIL
jgi:hypothetical protein